MHFGFKNERVWVYEPHRLHLPPQFTPTCTTQERDYAKLGCFYCTEIFDVKRADFAALCCPILTIHGTVEIKNIAVFMKLFWYMYMGISEILSGTFQGLSRKDLEIGRFETTEGGPCFNSNE